MGERISGVFHENEPRFKPPVAVLDRLIAAPRHCGQTLPDGLHGNNGSYAMANFVVAAFASFFMQSPSFLAHQRYLATTHGRSISQTLFAVGKIPGDDPAIEPFRAGIALDTLTERHRHGKKWTTYRFGQKNALKLGAHLGHAIIRTAGPASRGDRERPSCDIDAASLSRPGMGWGVISEEARA